MCVVGTLVNFRCKKIEFSFVHLPVNDYVIFLEKFSELNE
jgi:hypothetical protein